MNELEFECLRLGDTVKINRPQVPYRHGKSGRVLSVSRRHGTVLFELEDGEQICYPPFELEPVKSQGAA